MMNFQKLARTHSERELDVWIAHNIDSGQFYYLEADSRPIMDPDPEPFEWEKHGCYIAKFWMNDPNEITKGDWLTENELEEGIEVNTTNLNLDRIPHYISGDSVQPIKDLMNRYLERSTLLPDDWSINYTSKGCFVSIPDEDISTDCYKDDSIAIAEALIKSHNSFSDE